jgi:hypothetical protein
MPATGIIVVPDNLSRIVYALGKDAGGRVQILADQLEVVVDVQKTVCAP